MRISVGVTDHEWFDYLRRLTARPVPTRRLVDASPARPSPPAEPLDEVNFWQPSPDSQFRAIRPGDLFLFKLHRSARTTHKDLIAGGGVFARYSILPIRIAWDAFESKNGAASLLEMRRQVT